MTETSLSTPLAMGAPSSRVESRELRTWSLRVGRAIALASATLVALAANGLLPGLTSGLSAVLFQEGAIRCLAEHWLTTIPTCPDVGIPAGQAAFDGLTPDTIGALFYLLPFVGANGAYGLLGTFVVLVSIWGTINLLRRFGVGFALAAGAGAVYLASPSILGLAPFPGTLWGFMALPAFIAADLAVLDRWADASPRHRLALVVVQSVLKTALLFTDGYTFIVCATVSTCLVIGWVWGRYRQQTRYLAIIAFVAAHGVAYLAYQALIPGGSGFQKSSIDLFRSMGLDLQTLYRPSAFIWWSTQARLATDYGTFWGDGSNATWNYVGILCLGLCVVGFVRSQNSRLMWPLLVASLITFVMALGPSVKVGDHRPPLGAEVTYQSYLMPASAGQLSLPTAFLDEHVPGITAMRGTYRWFLGTRLIVILLAAVAVQRLLDGAARRDRARLLRLSVGVLAVLAAAEIMPPPRVLQTRYTGAEQQRREIDAVSTSLAHAIPAGSRVVFTAGGTEANDFLASYLTAAGDYTTYNVGGDKNLPVSKDQWPAEIRNLILGSNTDRDTKSAFAHNDADVVVVPRFDLRWSSYSWPPAASYQQRGDNVAAKLADDPTLRIVQYRWFYTVTLR